MKTRVVKTASDASAVKTVRYHNNKRIIVKHFGSFHSEEGLKEMLLIVNDWIKDFAG